MEKANAQKMETRTVTWEEYKVKVWVCRDGVRKVKVKLELNLAGDATNNMKVQVH